MLCKALKGVQFCCELKSLTKFHSAHIISVATSSKLFLNCCSLKPPSKKSVLISHILVFIPIYTSLYIKSSINNTKKY